MMECTLTKPYVSHVSLFGNLSVTMQTIIVCMWFLSDSPNVMINYEIVVYAIRDNTLRYNSHQIKVIMTLVKSLTNLFLKLTFSTRFSSQNE